MHDEISMSFFRLSFFSFSFSFFSDCHHSFFLSIYLSFFSFWLSVRERELMTRMSCSFPPFSLLFVFFLFLYSDFFLGNERLFISLINLFLILILEYRKANGKRKKRASIAVLIIINCCSSL